MTEYFTSTVTSIGQDAGDMLDAGVVILFGAPCPDALAEVSVVHERWQSEADRDPQPGDVITIGEASATISRVGEIAGENLRTLGHIVVYLDGEQDALLPGAVHATGSLGSPKAGDVITIRSA